VNVILILKIHSEIFLSVRILMEIRTLTNPLHEVELRLQITAKYAETHYRVLHTDFDWNSRSPSGRVGLNPWALNYITS
jgi:hypothetical protein